LIDWLVLHCRPSQDETDRNQWIIQSLLPRIWLTGKISSLLGFWLNVVFINSTWGVEFRDSHKIKHLKINNWSYTTNVLDYWTLDVAYITLINIPDRFVAIGILTQR